MRLPLLAGSVFATFLVLLPSAGAAPVTSTLVLNDGSHKDNLIQLTSTNAGEDVLVTLDPNNSGSLTAAQIGDAFFAKRTVWYANNVLPTNGVYTVSAAFKPAQPAENPNRGGVMGWLNLNTSKGVSFQVRVDGIDSSFRLSVVDFRAERGADNESATNLYHLDGRPALEELNSAWAGVGNYDPSAFAVFQLEFTAPTAADLQAVSNVTAHVFAKVFQASAGSTNLVQAGGTIELLTDLALPSAQKHRFGYYAFWGSVVLSGGLIGDLDNLLASGDVQSVANTPPTVSLTRPLQGAIFASGADLRLEAQASDPDGGILRVEFFLDDSLVATALAPPFETTLTMVEAGGHVVRVRAVDMAGGSATSASVQITVQPAEGATLQIQRSGDNSVLITWPAGFENSRLEASSTLLPGSWTTVASSGTSASVSMVESNRFFRLAAP